MVDVNAYGPWAIIAGASGGVGASFAHQLGQAGINLVLIARQKDLLEGLAREVSAQRTVQVRVLPLDLSRPDALDRIREITDDIDVGLVAMLLGCTSNELLDPRDLAADDVGDAAGGVARPLRSLERDDLE